MRYKKSAILLTQKFRKNYIEAEKTYKKTHKIRNFERRTDMVISVDTGNKMIKTEHYEFNSGIDVLDTIWRKR